MYLYFHFREISSLTNEWLALMFGTGHISCLGLIILLSSICATTFMYDKLYFEFLHIADIAIYLTPHMNSIQILC